MPLGNVLDTELKHKQNYFARRIKHNSQTDEKREMLTIYNACGAEKKTVWRHTALLPSGNLNFRPFDSSGDAVSITFKELVGHILSTYVTRDLYAVTSIVDYCISTEMFSIKPVHQNKDSRVTKLVFVLMFSFIILAQSWNLPTCFLGRSGSCGREFGGIVYRC